MLQTQLRQNRIEEDFSGRMLFRRTLALITRTVLIVGKRIRLGVREFDCFTHGRSDGEDSLLLDRFVINRTKAIFAAEYPDEVAE